MKNTVKKSLAIFLAVVMLFGTAPIFSIDFSAQETEALYSVGNIVKFGSYPQSKVTQEATLSALNGLITDESWVSYGYYSGNGEHGSMAQGNWMKYADVTYDGAKYRAVRFTQYRPLYVYRVFQTEDTVQSNNGYIINTTYWFKYEPLSWRVLDPETGYIMCETIIDSQAHDKTLYMNAPRYYNNPECTIYASDYATSSLRAWLNDDFYYTAFTEDEQADIRTTVLNNDAFNAENAVYNSAETNDKVFLLSYSDVLNSAYAFSSSDSDFDSARLAKGSDYAKSQGLWVQNDSEAAYAGNSVWRLRTPSTDSCNVCSISNNGSVIFEPSHAGRTSMGIRPALIVDMSSVTPETVPVDGVALDVTSKALNINATQQLTAKVKPVKAMDKAVTYTSSDAAVATVSATGLVTAKSAGTATITVTTVDGEFTATCAITVNAPTVTINNNTGSKTINYGEKLELTATVTNPPADYEIVWYIDGVEQTDGVTGNTFTAPSATGDYTVTVKIVDKDGKIINDASGNPIKTEENVTVKAGFFQKLIAFFRKLFVGAKIVVQAFEMK